jgi:hypothetical protein
MPPFRLLRSVGYRPNRLNPAAPEDRQVAGRGNPSARDSVCAYALGLAHIQVAGSELAGAAVSAPCVAHARPQASHPL